MKSLADLHERGGDWERFVEMFVTKVHRGRWPHAEDHWERTVVDFLNTSEMEELSARRATETAQRLAKAHLWYAAKRWGTCSWCS
ncbi:DUF6313 family protein [Nonomuraea sp. NPDC048882]|uniref:DUF6313 family protein n=1 Tax=Nonomuraea sp. NPDC048882 TaxID=3154347 RepID=UPI003404E2AE